MSGQWEYRTDKITILIHDRELDSYLNKIGQDGWEAWNFSEGVEYLHLYLKRPISTPSPAKPDDIGIVEELSRYIENEMGLDNSFAGIYIHGWEDAINNIESKLFELKRKYAGGG